MRREAKSCLYCDKPFFVNLNHINQIYCSEIHRKLAWKKRNRNKENAWARKRWRELHPETHITKICSSCKKEFTTDTGHKYQKYCSIYCRNKKNQTPDKKKVWRKNYWNHHKEAILERNEKWKAKNRFGATSKTLNKKLVLERDNKICQLCQAPYQVIHHIRYSGKVEDLVALCRSCHMRVHHEVKKEPFWIGNYKFKEIII